MRKKWSDLQGDPLADIKRAVELIRGEVGYQKVWRCECGWIGEVKDMPKHKYEVDLERYRRDTLHERRW